MVTAAFCLEADTFSPNISSEMRGRDLNPQAGAKERVSEPARQEGQVLHSTSHYHTQGKCGCTTVLPPFTLRENGV